MTRLLLFFAGRPWLGLGMLLLASGLAATQLHRLEVRVSADEMLVSGDPERAYHDGVEALFGDRGIVLLVLEDDRLLDADKLEHLRQTIHEIEALPFVAETQSLFNVPYLRSEDGFLKKTPYLAAVPESTDDTQRLLAAARANPLVADLLVSRLRDAMVVAILLEEESQPIGDELLNDAINRAAAPLHDVYERVYPIGFARVRTELAERIVQEQGALIPLAVGTLMLALFVLLRQLLDILTPLITASVSILWTFGLMGWLGIPINVVTSTIPILLLVVGSTEDIHLIAQFRHSQRQGDPVQRATRYMARKMGRTVLLTFLTTWAGFLSVGLSGIEALKQFGLVASTGLLFNFVVTVVFIPAALTLAGRWRLDGRSVLFDQRARHWARRYWLTLCRHRSKALFGLGMSAALALTGLPRIDLHHNPIESLGPESATAQDIEHLNTGFAGLESFSIVLDAGIQDTFLQSRYLEELIEAQRFVQSLDSGLSATSFADYLTLLNRAFLEDDTAGAPRSNEEIAELMLFLDQDRVSAYVSEDYSQARIIVRHSIADTDRLKSVLAGIRDHLEGSLDRGLRARLTGDSVLSLSATRKMVFGQLQSVLSILALFVVIVALLFTDVRVGLLAALPNAFPIVILFGVMGYAGIPLNIGTAMAAAVAIGIAVDDTLHFLLRYHQKLRSSNDQQQAMQETLYEEALPVVSTSVALICGFLVFTQSGFQPVAQFGLLGALVIATALIADLVITPVIIASLRLVTLWELLSPEARQRVIPQSPLFRDMRPWQIRRFVASSTQAKFPPGAMVYRQKDESEALYLVMSGQIEVRLRQADPAAPPAVVDRFGPGQVFGDVALLAGEPRRTDAIATDQTTLLLLTREAVNNVTFLHPFLASRLFLNLARDVSCRWAAFIMRLQRGDSDPVERESDE